MSRDLDKNIRVLSFYNRPYSDIPALYNDKIFVHNDIMYATDGRIFCWTENLTDTKEFSFYFEKTYLNPDDKAVKEVKEALNNGDRLERIIKQFNYYPLEFDLDFSDCPLPLKLMDKWKNRYVKNPLYINFETNEATFNFCGGSDADGGVTGIYGDVIKNVSGKPENLGFPMWYLFKTMDLTKVKTIHFKYFPERRHLTFHAGKYNFLAMAYENGGQ